MGTGTLPDIDIDPATFDTTYTEELVSQKYDRDASGNLRTAYPSSSIVSRFTAGYGNTIDNMLRAIQRRLRGEVRIGTYDDTSVNHGAIWSWDTGAARALLRTAGDSAYASLQALQMYLGNGARILDRNGAIEGNEIAGRGSLGLRTDDGTAWVKTTPSGNTGWVQIGAGSSVIDSFGWSGSTASAYYIPFASKIVESGTMSTQHLYRCMAAGVLNRVVLLCQNDPGATDFDVMAADGSTSLADQTGVTASAVSWSASSTAYELDFADLRVDVSEGAYISMLIDPTNGAGEVTGWLEITPS
jgi:hypothetical protein